MYRATGSLNILTKPQTENKSAEETQLGRLRRGLQLVTRRQWIVISFWALTLSFYSWRKSVQFDGGVIMRDMTEKRPLAEFSIRPWKVEEVVRNGDCGHTRATMKWGMVTIVKSSLRNRDRRDAIRATWGQIRAVGGALFRVVFILGAPSEETLKRDIKKESEEHGDLLVYNLPDSRRFLSDKIIAGMQWASTTLSPPWLYSSSDDDFLLHPVHIAAYFNQVLDQTSQNDLPIVCVYNYQWWDSPDRDSTSKWFCSSDLYPGWYWPRYCRGGMYSMSSRMLRRIFEVSRKTAYLHLDDVWITGLMRWKLGENDSNIIPAPLSQRRYSRFLEEQDPATVLVQHMWGNVSDLKKVASVANDMRSTWKKWRSAHAGENVCEGRLPDTSASKQLQ